MEGFFSVFIRVSFRGTHMLLWLLCLIWHKEVHRLLGYLNIPGGRWFTDLSFVKRWSFVKIWLHRACFLWLSCMISEMTCNCLSSHKQCSVYGVCIHIWITIKLSSLFRVVWAFKLQCRGDKCLCGLFWGDIWLIYILLFT